MMDNAKRPNLKEIVTVAPPHQYHSSIETAASKIHAKNSVSSLASVGGGDYETPQPVKARQQPSKLAMAGSLNILSTKGGAPSLVKQQADEDRVKKAMLNMEKEKSL